MAQRTAKDDYLMQREKFMKMARKLGADEKSDKIFFEVMVRKIAKAPPQKAKKAACKPKG